MIKKIISAFIAVIFASSAIAVNTPNKGYNNQTTGTNASTWGIVLNSNFSTIDNNLGGTLTLSVAGSSNVTLSLAQAQNLIYNFTGVLTGNINVIFPAAGGLYFINNQTTGSFTLTVQAGSSVNGFLVPQGTQVPIYVDNSTSPPTIGGAAGTQYVYTAPVTGGTANALTISSTLPSNFTLSNGTFLTFTPSNFNTASATLTTPDGTTATIQKTGATGLVNLQPGDLSPTPVIAQYNGSVWIYLNALFYTNPIQQASSFTLTFSGLYVPYIATSAINVTLGTTTDYGPIFNTQFLSEGGAVTLIPNLTDTINGVNSNFVIPQGSSGKLQTDGAGHWWVYFANAPLASPAFTGIPTAPTAAGGTNTTQLATTAFVHGILASPAFTGIPTAPTASTGTNTTQIATTAFSNPASSIASNGYVELPSGLLLEWGSGTTSGGSLAVNFPQAFSSAVYSIQMNCIGNTGVKSTAVTASSTSGFTAFTWVSGSAGNTGFYWMAVGQ